MHKKTLLAMGLLGLSPVAAHADVTASDVTPFAPHPLVARVVSTWNPNPEPDPRTREVWLTRSGSSERTALRLLEDSGDPSSVAQLELSLLARPAAIAARPSLDALNPFARDPSWVAEGIRRLHPGLVERLAAIALEFPGHAIEIVPAREEAFRAGSRHGFGLAVDVRVEGVGLEIVHQFASRFERTGVGLMRAANYVHIDVRQEAERWIDESSLERASVPARIAAPPPTVSSTEGIEPYQTIRRDDVDAEQVEPPDVAAEVEAMSREIERSLGRIELQPNLPAPTSAPTTPTATPRVQPQQPSHVTPLDEAPVARPARRRYAY
jgi:Bacterial protein of unknown function (DUF882)